MRWALNKAGQTTSSYLSTAAAAGSAQEPDMPAGRVRLPWPRPGRRCGRSRAAAGARSAGSGPRSAGWVAGWASLAAGGWVYISGHDLSSACGAVQIDRNRARGIGMLCPPNRHTHSSCPSLERRPSETGPSPKLTDSAQGRPHTSSGGGAGRRASRSGVPWRARIWSAVGRASGAGCGRTGRQAKGAGVVGGQ